MPRARRRGVCELVSGLENHCHVQSKWELQLPLFCVLHPRWLIVLTPTSPRVSTRDFVIVKGVRLVDVQLKCAETSKTRTVNTRKLHRQCPPHCQGLPSLCALCCDVFGALDFTPTLTLMNQRSLLHSKYYLTSGHANKDIVDLR